LAQSTGFNNFKEPACVESPVFQHRLWGLFWAHKSCVSSPVFCAKSTRLYLCWRTGGGLLVL